jgi:hypothetical protein
MEALCSVAKPIAIVEAGAAATQLALVANRAFSDLPLWQAMVAE